MLTPWPRRSPKGPAGYDTRRGAVLGAHADRVSVLNVLWEVVTEGPAATTGVAGGRAVATDALTDGWRVRVSAEDLRDAWDAWLAARDAGAPPDRVQDLRDDVDRLARAVAQQRADDASSSVARPTGLRPFTVVPASRPMTPPTPAHPRRSSPDGPGRVARA